MYTLSASIGKRESFVLPIAAKRLQEKVEPKADSN
jgi:hypothetical protein